MLIIADWHICSSGGRTSLFDVPLRSHLDDTWHEF